MMDCGSSGETSTPLAQDGNKAISPIDESSFAAEDDEVESFVGGFVMTVVIFCKVKTSFEFIIS